MIVIFSTSNKWYSRLIRWFTSSEVSHVAMLLKVEGVPVVFHADTGGVQFVPFDRFLTRNSVVASFRYEGDHDVAKALAHVGESYDYVGLLTRALLLTIKRHRSPIRSPNRQVCSELVARALPIFLEFDPETASPQDLYLVAKALLPRAP